MSQNGKLRLKLVDENGKLLNESVEIQLTHRTLNDQRTVRAKASRRIVIKDLHTAPQGLYQLEVHPGSFEPQGQIVEILQDGFTEVGITFRQQAQPAFAQQVVVGKGLRNQVLAIAKIADRSLRELREIDPELYGRLAARAEAERGNAELARVEANGAEDLAARGPEPERVTQVADPAAADLPLKMHPLFQRELRQAEVFQLADLTALPDPKIEKLLTRIDGLAALDDATLRKLVKEKALTEPEARGLGLTASLYRIAGERLELAEALTRSSFASLTGAKKVSRPQDLVALDVKAWEDVLESSGVEPPAGLDRRVYAERLRRKVTALFPTEALLQGSPPLRRPNLVARIAQANPKAELLTLDLSAGSADVEKLRFPKAVSPEARKEALADLKSAQRAYALTGDVDDARTLLAKRYDSSLSVASLPLETFQQESGLEPAKAREVHEEARAKTTAVAVATGAVLDIARGGFTSLAVSNANPDILNEFLKKIPGFTDLFGSQNYCRCEHCQSVLGPAAYFVDLMRFVESHVLDRVFVNDRSTHPLNLKVRRPDLWKLPLTCENTDTLVPYLDIINEILENHFAWRTGFPQANLGDRNAVENHVYATLPTVVGISLRPPFFLSLVQLDAYLDALESSRAIVARTLAAPPSALTAAVLGTSESELALITRPQGTFDSLKLLYGVPFVLMADGKVEPFDAQLLLRPTELSRAELGEAIATSFVTGSGSGIVIQAEKRDADSVQNDVEHLHGLDAGALDRLQRFKRLLRRLPWSIAELDLVLTQLRPAPQITALDPVLPRLAKVLALADRWGLAVEENCALWSEIPRTPPGTSLFDRLFNLPPFARLDGPLPKNDLFIHPAFRAVGTPIPADNTMGRLLAGLRVNEDQLAQLIEQLKGPLALSGNKGFPLTAGNLTLLYRHARLAALLGLTVAELFQMMGQASLNPGHVTDLDSLEKLLDYHDAWKESGFTLDDVGFVTGGLMREPGAYPDKERLAREIVADVKAQKSLEFADTVFAFLPGVTEEQSRGIVVAAVSSEAVVRNLDGSLRLTRTFNPATPLANPAGNTAENVAKAWEVLLRYHTGQVLPLQLGRLLALPVDKAAALVKLTGINLAGPELADALHGGAISPLTELVGKASRLAVLFRDSIFDSVALEWIGSQTTIFGGFNAPAMPTVATVRKVALYTAFAKAPGADPAALRQVLADFNPTKALANLKPDTLVRTLPADAALVATVLPNVTLPGTALEALAMLGRCAALARNLGVDGETLKLVVGTDAGGWQRASRAMLGTVRSRAADEAAYLARIEPFEDRIRSLKRDALVDFLTRSTRPEFETPSDLYHHFLIDVQLDGCARTSRLVAAISSLQLYVHRCLMNLEQDRLPEGDPNHVRVPPERIPADQWSWRKNYQVWVANRRVFLYPENYMEPELRDDRTPLFRELEDRLLQQQINEETVLDAYAAYMSGFEEVARLKIAGSYHDVGTNGDLLHLFGVTPSDPPTYYYRTVENARSSETPSGRGIVWSPWRKIDVQIPVRKVAPIMFQGRLLVFWVEIVTTPKNKVVSGESKFEGYRHRLTLKYTILKLDGTWTPPQVITLKDPQIFTSGDGVIIDRIVRERPEYQIFDNPIHTEPIDSYSLEGYRWDQVYPEADGGRLVIANLPVGRSTLSTFEGQHPIDFYRKVVGPFENRFDGSNSPGASVRFLSSARGPGVQALSSFVIALRGTKLPPAYSYYSVLANSSSRGQQGDPTNFIVGSPLENNDLARIPLTDEIAIVNGALSDAVLDIGGDLLLIQGALRTDAATYVLKRIGTTLCEKLSRTLFTSGVDGLLALGNQQSLKEAPLPIAITPPSPPRTVPFIEDKSNAGKLDFKGPYGAYFREIFFHVPFLIAHQLNSQQRFAAAQRWYRYAFDPTAGELTNPSTDRVWRYLEFRNLGAPKLREILTDTAALEVYKKDPFNPHAIARLRLSAYQKNVVMKYVDNLLDWGDSLFTQFTTESINEATLLYVLAADILGPRPVELGSCGEGNLSPKTYEKIKPSLKQGSELLLEIENLLSITSGAAVSRGKERVDADFVLDRATVGSFERSGEKASGSSAAFAGAESSGAESPAAAGALARPYDWKRMRFASWTTERGETVGQLDHASPLIRDLAPLAGFAEGLLSQVSATDSGSAEAGSGSVSPIFCVPENKELRQYWDRVEDRLFKIRHCLDITGAKRQLALFAPEIDPRLLVRARAAGLSIEDVLNATSGNLPPYRFTYLIEKARQYAGTVQSFGAALLSALEKRDVEELNRLRSVHQQNLLRLTTRIRELDIETAKDATTTLERQQAAAQYRRDHYQGLVEGGLSTAERVQQVSRHLATTLHGTEATLGFLAGALHLIPDTGSPFAMKYGGTNTGSSANSFMVAVRALTDLAENISSSAGLEAGFQRREEDWQHQVQLADHELKQLEKQLTAARLREEIAVRSLTLHQQTVQQEEEVFEFYKDRFTNLGLYTWLSTNLQRLHREAYNSAYAMARLAEQAYRFERGDDASPLLQPESWDAAKAGLLSGERLLLDLQHLERRFLETNFRSLEIDQSFSLTQINPAALVKLREKGECDFSLPEVFFDLFYPGQYRRRIRAVRLTIPCVTGPHTNVGATLTLTGSKMRMKPQLDAPLADVPRRRTVSIASSKAQNDSGVFELSFRDERYMPFEGAGAVSDWSLTLPKSFKPFDYQTIADVLLHVSYTAEEDGAFRDKVEDLSANAEKTIRDVLSKQGLRRVFSLRQDFPSAFDRLLHKAAGTAVPITITDKHLPLFLQGRSVRVTKARLALKTPPAQELDNVVFTFNGDKTFSADVQLGGLHASDVTTGLSTLLKEHVLSVKTAGALAPAPRPGDPSALDAEKLLDVLLYVEYQVT